MSRVEGVRPGGDILLSASGAARVKRALAAVDAVEAAGFDPARISPDHYRQVHNRIAVRRPVPTYGEDRHAAYLGRRRVLA